MALEKIMRQAMWWMMAVTGVAGHEKGGSSRMGQSMKPWPVWGDA